MTLYEIKEAYLKALEAMEVNEDGEVLNAEQIELAEGEFMDKVESVGIYIKSLQAEAKAYKEERANLTKQMESCEKKAERLMEYLDMNLKAAGLTSHKTAKVNISYRKSEKVILEDETLIPDEFKEAVTEIKISKTDIKKAIKDGAEVPGAYIERCENLQVK